MPRNKLLCPALVQSSSTEHSHMWLQMFGVFIIFYESSTFHYIHLHLCFVIIHMASNPMFPTCTWHINIDLHFIYKLVSHGAIWLRHVPTIYHLTVIFTKGMSYDCFFSLCFQLQLREISLQLRGSVKYHLFSLLVRF